MVLRLQRQPPPLPSLVLLPPANCRCEEQSKHRVVVRGSASVFGIYPVHSAKSYRATPLHARICRLLQPRGVCSAQHFVDGAVLLARRCALRVYRRARGASRALTRSAARRGAEHTLGRCCAPRAAEAVAEGGKHAHCQIRLRSGWLSTRAGGAGRTPLSL